MCPATVIDCPMRAYGCLDRFTRASLPQHAAAAAVSHLQHIHAGLARLDRLASEAPSWSAGAQLANSMVAEVRSLSASQQTLSSALQHLQECVAHPAAPSPSPVKPRPQCQAAAVQTLPATAGCAVQTAPFACAGTQTCRQSPSPAPARITVDIAVSPLRETSVPLGIPLFQAQSPCQKAAVQPASACATPVSPAGPCEPTATDAPKNQEPAAAPVAAASTEAAAADPACDSVPEREPLQSSSAAPMCTEAATAAPAASASAEPVAAAVTPAPTAEAVASMTVDAPQVQAVLAAPATASMLCEECPLPSASTQQQPSGQEDEPTVAPSAPATPAPAVPDVRVSADVTNEASSETLASAEKAPQAVPCQAVPQVPEQLAPRVPTAATPIAPELALPAFLQQRPLSTADAAAFDAAARANPLVQELLARLVAVEQRLADWEAAMAHTISPLTPATAPPSPAPAVGTSAHIEMAQLPLSRPSSARKRTHSQRASVDMTGEAQQCIKLSERFGAFEEIFT